MGTFRETHEPRLLRRRFGDSKAERPAASHKSYLAPVSLTPEPGSRGHRTGRDTRESGSDLPRMGAAAQEGSLCAPRLVQLPPPRPHSHLKQKDSNVSGVTVRMGAAVTAQPGPVERVTPRAESALHPQELRTLSLAAAGCSQQHREVSSWSAESWAWTPRSCQKCHRLGRW